MRLLLFFLVMTSLRAFAGQHCGAEGDWRRPYIPDKWGKAKLYTACIRHDQCYSTRGAQRAECDHRFKGDLFAECKRAYGSAHAVSGCRPAAIGYYELVVAYGAPYFDEAQQKVELLEFNSPDYEFESDNL